MTETSNRKLKVFLCHASEDKPAVRELSQRLSAEGWIDPWLDEEKLLPGQDWGIEIEKAVEGADVIIVSLSSKSVSKEGYVQKELKTALNFAIYKPEATLYIVPLRLDECTVPHTLQSIQYEDYFPEDKIDEAYKKLYSSLAERGKQLKIPVFDIQRWNEQKQERDDFIVSRLDMFSADVYKIIQEKKNELDATTFFEAMRDVSNAHQMPEYVDVNELLVLVTDSFKELNNQYKKEVKFHLNCGTGLPKIRVHKQRLLFALEALVNNVNEEVGYGGVITITTRVNRSSDNTNIEIEVVDDGVGISPTDLQKIFELGEGLKGYGLWRCRNIIEALGGSILVSSEMDKGSKFLVRLPVSEKE